MSPKFVRLIWLCVCCSLFIGFVGVPMSRAAESKVLLTPRVQTYLDSMVAFVSGDVKGAETLLVKLNRKPLNTVDGDIELAFGWVRIAMLLQGNGQQELSGGAAQQALAALARAEGRNTATPSQISNIYHLTGTIYERLWGDTNKARESYRVAVQKDPQAMEVKHALKRLDDADAIVKQKVKSNGKG